MRERWRQTLRARAEARWTEAHTREVFGDKRLLLHPAEASELLRALGLITAHAEMPAEKIRKFRQIQHMLGVLRPALIELCQRYPTVHLIDAGCGRSYLTLLIAWWFERARRHPAHILGVDRDPKVIKASRDRARIADLHGIAFRACTLEALGAESPAPVHALISLHACDTATDDALALAVRCGARFIAVAPCCQRELSAAWKELDHPEHPWAPLWDSPHQRRTTAATVTDTFRALLLEAEGYETRTTEFVEALHTPKNTLIRAMRRDGEDGEARAEAAGRYRRLVEASGGAEIALRARLAR